jgi:hypothetical protein
MKNFDSWYLELLEDQMWYEMASRNHSKGTFEATALKVYTLGISDSQTFFLQPMKEHRNHVYNKLCKLPPDKIKKPWHEIKLQEEEEKRKKEEPEWIPLTGEERQKRLQEFLEVVKSAPPVKVIAPISHREIMLNGQVDKPKDPPYPSTKESEVIAHALHLEYIKQNYDPYTKLKLEGWQPESIWLENLQSDERS